MHGKPGCALPSVGWDDEYWIRCHRHHLTVPEIDDAHIDPMLRRHNDLRTLRAERWQNHVLKDLGRDLAKRW